MASGLWMGIMIRRHRYLSLLPFTITVLLTGCYGGAGSSFHISDGAQGVLYCINTL
jgi:hypothetical protein